MGTWTATLGRKKYEWFKTIFNHLVYLIRLLGTLPGKKQNLPGTFRDSAFFCDFHVVF